MNCSFETPKFKNPQSLIKSVLSTVVIANIILAAVSFAKDLLLASYLGTSGEADAFYMAFFIPDNFGNNLLAASAGVACVPLFSGLFVGEEFNRLYGSLRNITLAFMIISCALAAGMLIFRNETVALVAGVLT